MRHNKIVRCSPQILLGKMLGEKAQLNACKDIVAIVDKLMNTLELGPENASANNSGGNSETMYSQHLLVVALQELGKYSPHFIETVRGSSHLLC